MTTLAEHLVALPPDALAALVATRSDATSRARPGSLGELAARLDSVVSASTAMSGCDAQCMPSPRRQPRSAPSSPATTCSP